MWRIKQEFSCEKEVKKRREIFYVSPEPYDYGYATFLDEFSAIIYCDKVNSLNIVLEDYIPRKDVAGGQNTAD